MAGQLIHTNVHVYLTFKTGDRPPYEKPLLDANKDKRLLLLTQTKDLVFVFVALKLKGKKPEVFVLSRADLGSVHVWSE